MSSEQSEKLKLIRESERLKTKELAELIELITTHIMDMNQENQKCLWKQV